MDDPSKPAVEDTNMDREANLQEMTQGGANIQGITGATGSQNSFGRGVAKIQTNSKWLASLELSDATELWKLFKSCVRLSPKHRLLPEQVLTIRHSQGRGRRGDQNWTVVPESCYM